MVKLDLVKRECVATSIHITVRCTSFMAISGELYDFTITIDKGSCNSNADILLEVLDANSTVIYTQTLNSGTQTYTTQFTASTSGAYIITVQRINNASNCYFLIDDVLITHEEEVTQTLCEDFAGYRYGFNGQEKDNEISGAGNSYTAEFWQYDSRTGRRWNVDPVNKDWHGSYTTFSNNPIIYVDPNGDVDFYNTKGSKVGTDGVNDGIIMVVTDKKIAREMYKKYKKGHKITAVEMNKMKAVLFQLPSQKVRKAVQAAHIRANTPSENDKKGDSHEEGGAWGIDKEGNEKVIEAVPGEVYVEGSPHVDIDVFKAKNPEDKGTIEDGNYMGTYHIHPRKEKFIKTESFLDGRKITVTKSAGPFFTQYPSTGGLVDDYKPHQQAIDYGILNKDAIGIVVGAYSNIATFYNASRENNVTIPTSLLYNYKETGKSYKEEKKDAKKKN